MSKMQRLLFIQNAHRITPCCSSYATYPDVTPPYYRKQKPKIVLKEKENESLINNISIEFPNRGDASGIGPRFKDYQWMSQMVKSLPTVQDKIDFINPYERPWSRFEKTWHRDYHPPLHEPRKAFLVNPVPEHGYDYLNFYKYITKTRLVHGLNEWHANINPPTRPFMERFTESLAVKLDENSDEKTVKSQFVNVVLRQLVDDVLATLPSYHLRNSRISFTDRCESFWIRAGFAPTLYERTKRLADGQDEFTDFSQDRYPADDVRKLGELSFACCHRPAVNIRTRRPLTPLFNLDDHQARMPPLDECHLNDIVHPPSTLGFSTTGDRLSMTPGYEPDSGDAHRFGLVALSDCTQLAGRCHRWQLDSVDELVQDESMDAAAVVALFSWMNGQAHAMGFNQYNDLVYPFVSQLIQSDGRQFHFSIGQLNTLAFNIDEHPDGFSNPRSNVCFTDGPYCLYDRYEHGRFSHVDDHDKLQSGLNERVVAKVLSMFLLAPDENYMNDRKLAPFVPKIEKNDDQQVDILHLTVDKSD